MGRLLGNNSLITELGPQGCTKVYIKLQKSKRSWGENHESQGPGVPFSAPPFRKGQPVEEGSPKLVEARRFSQYGRGELTQLSERVAFGDSNGLKRFVSCGRCTLVRKQGHAKQRDAVLYSGDRSKRQSQITFYVTHGRPAVNMEPK